MTMKRLYILSLILLLPLLMMAQNIRYVCNNNDAVKANGTSGAVIGYHVKGAYKNDGKSWATAKENIQDAINDLVANKLTGEVWVAEGTYSPTESTEASGGSTLYMSFKIPAGITVRGGFKGMLTESQLPADAIVTSYAQDTKTLSYSYTSGGSKQTASMTIASGKEGEASLSQRAMNSAQSSSIGESTKYRTVLTGSLKDVQNPVFTWNETKGQFDTQFYGNCYHVVTFATNGFDSEGRANPLIDGGPAAVATELASKEYVAKLEGFVVQNGNAKNSSLDGHPHNAYGGGVYMVPGSMVENIYFTHCEASRDGGAIYMDGGGIVRHCYVADCQALGVDLSSGYGGGICVDENKQIYPPQVTRSTMVNCVGRYGGGMASKVTHPDVKYQTPGKTYDMRYNNGIGSNLIANCTATTEGGGAYSYQGGSWTQMTIVNNKCMGSGVTINGMKTGQSAGIYVRDAAMIGNSIFWGGETKAAAAGQSAQFASSRSTKDAKIELFNVALNNSDHTNWSGTVKDNVIMLSNYNSYSAAKADGKADNEMADAGYPVFHHPSTTKGHEENAATLNYIPYRKNESGTVTSNGYDYKMAYSSAATFAGVLTTDRDTEKKTPARSQSYDILGDLFSSFPTLGAYVADAPSVAPSIEWTTVGVEGIAHVYVDPNANYIDDEQYAGSSWKTPIIYLRDAFIHINDELPALLSDGGKYSGYTINKLQIHVKAGTVDMNGSMATGSVRASSLVIPSTIYTKNSVEQPLPIEVLGSYDESLTYTPGGRTTAQLNALTSAEYRQVHGLDDPSKRNPIKTPTVISGSVLNDYKYNIAHLFKIEDRQDEEITIDGFYMRYGNALSTELFSNPANAVTTGAAFSIKNSSHVTIRNVKVSDCQASNGAAVYATGSASSPTNVTFENCIFHNNTTTYSETSGNIYCDATSSLTFDHCDILRNVGYPFYNLGTVKMDNSIVYANMSEPVPDTNSYGVANDGQPANANDKSLVAFKGTGTYSSDNKHNLFDLKSRENTTAQSMKLYGSPWLQFNFDGGSNDNYPFFCNPTKNAGVSPKGDDTYYGREASFQPHNGNPAVNNASHSGDHTTWGTDMSTVITRDYGGMPDIGAIENHRATRDEEGENAYTDGFPAYGTQWYVRDYGTDLSIVGRDGMSWATAINGNGLYGSTVETKQYHISALKWEKIEEMSVGATKTVMLVNPHKRNGYILGYDNGTQGYGAGFENSTAMVNSVDTKKSNDAFKFTLTKTASGYKLASANGGKSPNKSGSSVVWGDPTDFSLSHATSFGSTNDFMLDISTDYTIRFAQENNFLNAQGNYQKLKYATGTGEWSVWYVYEVTESMEATQIRGLQYAVDKAHEVYENSGAELSHVTEVWVGGGTYSKDPTLGDESCFMIRDGVQVYGSFPNSGNPGKEQRQVLCSQYVMETQGRAVANYETILEPITKTGQQGVVRRILGQPYECNPVKGDTRTIYKSALWDGFTLRDGVLDVSAMSAVDTKRTGGAAATVYENVTLRNIITNNNTTIYHNAQAGSNLRAGGIYMDGGTLESSYVINNKLEARNSSGTAVKTGYGYGGGLFVQKGTIYNSVIANNTITANYADGAAAGFITDAKFFNNTVVNNKADGSARMCGGLAMLSERTLPDNQPEAPSDTLYIYNSIIVKNQGYKQNSLGNLGNANGAVQINGRMQITNCVMEDVTQIPAIKGRYITFSTCQAETNFSNLFVTSGDITDSFQTLNLRLNDNAATAINHGVNAPGISGVLYDLEEYNDMDSQDRILDCTVDIGAFEYNNAYAITPDVTSEAGRAIYYVTPDGRELASADHPDNAACAAKLQKVLDAAGRYKYKNPEKQVIVKVARKLVGNKTDYIKPGSIASNEPSKNDYNNTKNYRQYLKGLKVVANGVETQVFSDLSYPTPATGMYQLYDGEIAITGGEKITFKWEFPDGWTTIGCVASVWMDTNGDKVFNQLLGRLGDANRNNKFSDYEVTIPSGVTGNSTRIRIRLESSWMINNTDANGQTNRMVYDIPVRAVNGTTSPASFQYYANRTVDAGDQDIRLWSIIVPRGVEVWGGYHDDRATTTKNGFFDKTDGTYKELRDILGNPVYFDASYYNKDEGTNAITYHVVSFADKVFDGNGNPYHEGDDLSQDAKAANSDKPLLKMSDKTTDRAVVDGIFIQGGQADANAGAASGMVNMNQYGGAAVVTDYAHVRNCIVRNNNGIYGGAFALTHNALISGTLIEKNSADYGGAVYVFEDGVKLSDGTTINTGQTATSENVAKMPRIYTSTIVNNSATKQGGGMWFTDNYNNVRVNSTLLWQNHCNDEANVYGDYSPIKADDDKTKAEDFFPFAYSAVQNMRLSGTNNQSVETSNANGIRIWKDGDTDQFAMANDQSNYSDFGYWRPTTYSVLLNTGMPITTYNSLESSIGLAANDFSATSRSIGSHRTYVDIGARALEKPLPNAHLMLRLFVAKPEDVDMDAATAMMRLNPEETDITTNEKNIRTYYKQEGSSFAYPFQSLQDALDYIVACRSVNMQSNAAELKSKCVDLDKAVDVPFEIFVAKGEYYPTKDIAGHYGESLANTFAIPEGVNIYGGFNCQGLKSHTGTLHGTSDNSKAFFGGYQAPDVKTYDPSFASKQYYILENNTKAPNGLVSGSSLNLAGYDILLYPTTDILPMRPKTDINKNSIVEPWEFENQTILSGNTTNETADGVYHVVTAVPDENVVGQLPKPSALAGTCGLPGYISEGAGYGYTPKEYGQGIILNGLTIMGGYAEDFKVGQLDNLSKNIYFKGGGLVADGNRYNNSYNDWVANDDTYKTANPWTKTATAGYKHNDVTNNIAYRDVAIVINDCKFRDNVAGFGGAIAANCEVNIYNSSFENNLALAGSDTNVDGKQIDYPGQGGAILCSYSLSAYNTVFANNEARDDKVTTPAMRLFKTAGNQDGANLLGGAGGAIYIGKFGNFHIINCDIVRNKANAYPAVFTMNPNYYKSEWNNGDPCYMSEYSQLENTVIWGNELNDKLTYTPTQKFATGLICNYGATTRTIADPYNPALDGSVALPTAADFTDDATKEVLSRKWMETAWFSAYEAGRGIPANNAYDLRGYDHDFTKHLMYTMGHYQKKDAAGTLLTGTENQIPYQNSNIVIDSENGTLEGPNFGNPSKTAGIEGYREDTDWSPARICNLTDNGSGMLVQNADRKDFEKETDGTTYKNHGTYTAARYATDIAPANMFLPIGTDSYMKGAGTGLNIQRISFDPNPTHDQTYIDIGAYEYVHVPLTPTTEGDEVDILWVSDEERYGNGAPDGSSWTKPTSDLQRAIETLLASRNGHRKEIRLMDGEYSPVYTIKGHLAFYIDTEYLNSSVVLPEGYDQNSPQGVKSFTIKGGYSKELNNQYDVDLYPSIIRGKTRTATTGSQWDHAIYIADASQRYGINTAYSYATNGNGWWATSDDQSNKPDPKTIPIEIDGVTVVNDQALSGAKGAAIYYADQTFDANGLQSDAGTTKASGTTDAYITTNEEGSTHEKLEKTSPAKLILSKTKVYGSGNHNSMNENTTDVSAVYVGKYGGEALIYNNVFHSNYGDPLVAYNAHTVNNTFALNYGLAKIQNDGEYHSTIFNSVFWKNNPSSGTPETATAYNAQFSLAGYTADNASGDIFSHNAYTGGNTSAIEYGTTGGNTIHDNNYNVGLINNNTDAIYGPNFTDPENADISKRSFKLAPNMRLLNRGLNGLYANAVVANSSDATKLDNATTIYDYAWVPTTEKDAASAQRVLGSSIDIGAYEYQSRQYRVLYVDPNKMVTTANDKGTSWDLAFGYGKIQAAIDLAAIYYKDEALQTYVFVKSASPTNPGMHSGESLTFRNGVSVFGNVDYSYLDDCEHTVEEAGDFKYDETILSDYVKNLRLYHRSGIVSPLAGHTRILGINTNGTEFASASRYNTETATTAGNIAKANAPIALIDGFDVTAKTAENPTGTVSEPVINLRPLASSSSEAGGDLHMAVRNVVVHDNDASASDINIANVNNALLYDVLFHSNSVASDKAVLNLDVHSMDASATNHGYAVNCTVEGKTVGADGSTSLNNVASGTSAITGNTTASHVYNSLTNFGGNDAAAVATRNTLSGYCYKMEDNNLNYQLTENSKYIDACEVDNTIGGSLPTNFRGFINYQPVAATDKQSYTNGDIDLLGNFRLQTLGNLTAASAGTYTPLVDRGAFETWKVTQDVQCVYPDYPHDGSVEYIMDGKNLVIDPVADTGDNRGTAHYPGFVLIKNGGSLYGNGRSVMASYVAVERNITSADGVIAAVPYAMDYTKATSLTDATNTSIGVAKVSYSENGVTGLSPYANGEAYSYNGEKRSSWDYIFKADESSCWESIDADTSTPATQGVLYTAADLAKDDVIRFTARGISLTDYIYKEDIQEDEKHQSKTVTLTQNDDNKSTDGGADFTSQEDMGWNLIGIPYLVSDYKPYEKVKVDNNKDVSVLASTAEGYSTSDYALNLPHTLWLYYDGATYPDGTTAANGDGGFYSVPSWNNDDWHLSEGSVARLWTGEGIFTQTATINNSETLTFYRPVYTQSTAGSAKHRTNTRYYISDGEEEQIDIKSPIIISVRKSNVVVRNLEGSENISIYAVNGMLESTDKATEGTFTKTMLPGAYIVKVNGYAKKVMIK